MPRFIRSVSEPTPIPIELVLPPVVAAFAPLPDPRVERTKRHELLDIVAITLCAVVAGAEGWVDIAAFGHAREAWFRTFLALPHGIPSHDTFGRVFARLDDADRPCDVRWNRHGPCGHRDSVAVEHPGCRCTVMDVGSSCQQRGEDTQRQLAPGVRAGSPRPRSPRSLVL